MWGSNPGGPDRECDAPRRTLSRSDRCSIRLVTLGYVLHLLVFPLPLPSYTIAAGQQFPLNILTGYYASLQLETIREDCTTPRQVQIVAMQKYPHPYFWAAYQLTGRRGREGSGVGVGRAGQGDTGTRGHGDSTTGRRYGRTRH